MIQKRLSVLYYTRRGSRLSIRGMCAGGHMVSYEEDVSRSLGGAHEAGEEQAMPKTSAAAKEARQEQILTAAVRCFARRGYHATTIEDLVAETGLSRGVLYLYFPSKEAL